MTVHDLQNEIRQQVKAVIMIALAALAFAALIFPGQTGEVGMFFNNVLRMLFGEISVVLPGLCIVVGLQEILPWKISNIRQRKAGILLLTFILLVYVHLQVMENHLNLVMDLRFYKASWLLGVQQQGGGVFGAVFAMMLYFLFRDIGSYIVLLALGIIAFLLITHISLIQLMRSACRLLSVLFRLLWCGLKKTGSALKYVLFSEPKIAGPEKEDDEDDEPASFTGRHIKTGSSPQKQDPPLTLFSLDKPETTTKLAPVIPFPSQDIHVHEPAEKPVQPALHAVATRPDKDTLDSADMFPAVTLPAEPNEYMLPPLKILAKMPKQRDTQAQKTLVERAKILERTLESFGVRARVTDAQAGPTVTRFELQPEIGVKVSKIVALSDDLALNLAASDVRIEAPIPGKAAVGIEVPNKVIAPVYLREVLEDEQFQNAASALTIALGKDITGNPILADLMKMPHLLIAGSTGSGKSVCINVLIASILFKSRPDEVKFVMIDPKVVELSNFNGIPHLLMPVVTDAKRASLALKNMLKEMTHRYEIFAKEGVRDIHSFNERKRQQNDVNQLLPFIVVIIDELADLMMVAAADVEDSIARLAQMSRAAGIHLVIATQRPSVDVITGVIKANITSRIAFAVSSQADSRTILDMGGAEKLLGRGDALFHPIGLPKPFRIQGAFINERELGQLLEFIKNQGEPEFSEHLLPEDNQDDDFYEEDDLFPEAVMLFAEAGTASISLLQRRLRIGYTRAARLVDDMERRGFVGQFEGSKAREILITPDQAKKLLFDRDH